MDRILVICIVVLTFFITSFFFVISYHTSFFPNFISIPFKYALSEELPQFLQKLKKINDSKYCVSNDFAYANLPNENLSLDYFLDWSYHSNDTFHVERVLLSNNSIEKKYFFTKDYLHNLLYPSAFGQDSYGISYKSRNDNVRPKHFLFNEFGVVYNIKKGPLICSKKSNETFWINDDFTFHHSQEQDSEGNIWACGLKNVDTSLTLNYNAIPFYIVLVDPKNGKTIYSKSILDILEENNLNWMLDWPIINDGNYLDLHHLNDIQPILKDNLFAKKGDVLISLRNLNMILLFDPRNGKIKFHNFNLCQAQHDIDIYNDSCISIFSNNTFVKKRSNGLEELNSIVIYNFITNQKRIFKSEVFEKFKINTRYQGLCEIIDENNFMIEETGAGIVYVFEEDKVRTFFKKTADNQVSMTCWSRLTKINNY